ncbi:MAG: hypothetical protein JWM54_1997 [Acidobacteriaceae bacterium]|nr:hypothetical protein [Acidobacteriaceae bacterium]
MAAVRVGYPGSRQNSHREVCLHARTQRSLIGHSFFNVVMAPQVGLEPTTLRLTAECSAIELLRSVMCFRRAPGT